MEPFILITAKNRDNCKQTSLSISPKSIDREAEIPEKIKDNGRDWFKFETNNTVTGLARFSPTSTMDEGKYLTPLLNISSSTAVEDLEIKGYNDAKYKNPASILGNAVCWCGMHNSNSNYQIWVEDPDSIIRYDKFETDR